MEWSDLRIFLAIARAGTLGAAARTIGQSQPTLGRRLRALEDALGHVLLLRTSKGFVLTDEGRAALAYAEQIEEAAIGLARQVAEVDLGEPPPSRDTFVGYHRDLRRVMRLRATLDLVIERIGQRAAP